MSELKNKTNNEDVKKEVDINLSLSEVDENTMSEFRKGMLSDELAELPPLKEGEVSINGIYAYNMGDKLEVSVYIRNGLSKQVSLDIVPLVIVDENDKVLARQIFNMSDVGIIPPLGGRPSKIYFNKENIFVDMISEQDWKIQFEKSIKAVKTVKVEYEAFPEQLSAEVRNEFEEFLRKMPLINVGEVKILTHGMKKENDGSISIVLVICNGLDKTIKLNTLPITVIDAEDKLVAGGVFNIENISVNPSKARVYNFNLTPDKVLDKDADISKCKVVFKK
ncbi:SLAP domain-containing protein [Oceanirhabdus seepicola]|uniref:SLAP domain-containing protein n=1 Tax=Oceanirhabdus seepicola TaxID=2828781 RepID=A0A9J6P166_9CLOT|nr:SLAP domain-containing protein [Oceanirhabdus seepicola]MCM1990267.1 SLAP domain-containing protein [Oceanirhabdus seepicola]